MYHKLIFLLLFTSAIFAQNNPLLTLFDDVVIPDNATMDTNADSVKGHWVLDSLYMADQSRVYLAENLALPKMILSPAINSNGDFSSWSGDNPTGWVVQNESAPSIVTQNNGRAKYYGYAANLNLQVTNNTTADSTYFFRYSLDSLVGYNGGIGYASVYLSASQVNTIKSNLSGGSGTFVYKRVSNQAGFGAIRFIRNTDTTIFNLDNVGFYKIWRDNSMYPGTYVDFSDNQASPVYKDGRVINLNRTNYDRFYLTAAQSSIFNPGENSFTVEFKFKTSSTYTTNQYIVSKHTATDNYFAFILPSGKLCFKMTSSSNTIGDSTEFAVNDGDWHYGAMVCDRTAGYAYIYLDGNGVVAQDDLSGFGGITSTSSFCIGSIETGASATNFNGSIAEVRFSMRALSANEILQHWNYIKPKFNQINQ